MGETWVQELNDKEKIQTKWVKIDLNKADILTKCLENKAFNSKVSLISH